MTTGSDGADRKGPRNGRIRVTFDDAGPDASAATVGVAPAGEDDGLVTIRRRFAALMLGERRIDIPAAGVELGAIAPGATAAAAVWVRPDEAGSGDVVVQTEAGGAVFVNGERLTVGEPRALGRGDSIAVGGQLLHYLPAGQDLHRLAPVRALDGGRLKASKHELTIGRAPENDLVLDHPTVSRRHAVIRVQPTGTTIQDCGSATGVRVNGEVVRRAPLVAGDQLGIGPYRIVFDGEDLVERAAPSGLAVVAVEVRVDVPGATILQPTSVQLRPGELVAIIGESGAGKSTLLKTLAGVSPATGGRVLIGGEDVTSRLNELGYVPQFDIVHDGLSVTEALDYAAQLRLPADTDAAERRLRVAEVVEQLGLTDRADTRVARLSGGQRKRAAVGIELLHRPGALFLDEPTTGLDPGLERRMMELFRDIADAGQTVALVTHATGSIAMCDQVIVMGRGGRLAFEGSPAELLVAFGVEHFDDVYTALARNPDVDLTAFRPDFGRQPLPPVVRAQPRRQVRQAFGYQTAVLARRYATLLLRDRRHLRGALIQVPILGLLTALLFTGDVFVRLPIGLTPGDPGVPPLYAGKAAQLVFLMVTISMWLGSINAAREIVKERHVLAREMAVGVQLPAYLASKLLVLLTLATIQTVLFAAIVLVLRPLHGGSGMALVFVLVLSSWVAVLLGLLVSAYASSEDQATGVIPLLLVPQLLLAGAIVSLHDMTAPMHVLASLIPARWSFAAAGHAIDLQDRIDEDAVFAPMSRYGNDFFTLGPVPFVLICGAFAVALCALLVRLLRRPLPA